MGEHTIGELFEKAIGWENRMCEMYRGFAEFFPSRPDIQDVWRAMAADEARHAHALDEARDALDPAAIDVPADAMTAQLAASVDYAFAQADRATFATLDDVYEVAHDLESSELVTVFKLLAIEGIPDRAKRDLLAIQLEEHTRGLEEFGITVKALERRSIPVER